MLQKFLAWCKLSLVSVYRVLRTSYRSCPFTISWVSKAPANESLFFSHAELWWFSPDISDRYWLGRKKALFRSTHSLRINMEKYRGQRIQASKQQKRDGSKVYPFEFPTLHLHALYIIRFFATGPANTLFPLLSQIWYHGKPTSHTCHSAF